MLVFVRQFLQFLTRLFLVALFITHSKCSLAKVVLRLADHEKLSIRIVQELGLQRHPSKIFKFVKNPNKSVNMIIPQSPYGILLTIEGILDPLVIDPPVGRRTWDSSTEQSNSRVVAGRSPPEHHPTRQGWSRCRRDGMPAVWR